MKDKKPRGKAVLPLYDALQSIDQDVKPEYRFDWLFLPKSNERSRLENSILQSLQKHCSETSSSYKTAKKNASASNIYSDDLKIRGISRKLEFDFYLPKYNIVIEFDELQHFTKERKIALEHLNPDDYSFDVSGWIEHCSAIQINDADPPERDWQRAYRDTIRDIRSLQNSVPLLRLFVNDFDKDRLKMEHVRQDLIDKIKATSSL